MHATIAGTPTRQRAFFGLPTLEETIDRASTAA
jgi:hypothetical protein